MIPEMVDIGGSWEVLPSGLHDATLIEVEERFATNQFRRHLFKGLRNACNALRKAGCKVVYIDGSFVSNKPKPNDFDVCWDPIGVDANKLDLVFFEFKDSRSSQKRKYFGEFFPSSALADGVAPYVDYFQKDKETGEKKGIVRVLLSK